jgi:voltage-dependent calcium channel L type alpha-1D
MVSIIINTVVIFSDQHPISSEQLAYFELLNKIFYFIFVGEILIKMLGLGVINYIKDSYNIFDTLIIIFSTIEIALANADSGESNQLIRRVLIIFRPFRMLRIFKIARKWSSLNFVLVKMLNSFKEVGNFLVLLALFLFIYALLGMELYANNVKFDENDQPVKCETFKYCLENGKSPRINFDGLGDALLGVFVIVIGDDWNSIMAQYVRATNLWSVFYFISLTIMGNIVLLNLLLAILLREFEDESGRLLTSPDQNLPSFNLQEKLS